MYATTAVAALAAFASPALAAYKGFNYGSTFNDQKTPVTYNDFKSDFTTANSLKGASGFNSARLYTMIQAGTTNSPSEAFQAAIDTDTTLLMGMWASGGQQAFTNELDAFKAAIAAHGEALVKRTVGISVGSEDLYRISPTGIENDSGVGAGPDVIVEFVSQLREYLNAQTVTKGVLVGHVDTWPSFVNGSNANAIAALDFLGMDAYPYFQFNQSNPIELGKEIFFEAYRNTTEAAQGKPVWITETGWPVSGKTLGEAVPSLANAKTYWDEVACSVLGDINTWWYTLQDDVPTTPNPSFGLVGNPLSTTPLYDLTCPNGSGGGIPSKSGSSKTASKSEMKTATSSKETMKSEPTETGSSMGSDGTMTVEYTTYTTETACPKTYTESGMEKTTLAMSTMVVTSTKGGYSTAAPPQSVGSQAPAPAPSGSSGKSCPADLSGTYDFPHLIVPISSVQSDRAYGTSYNGTFSDTVSSLYNFDIPESDKDKTCTLVFLLPNKDELETSSFALSGSGGIDVKGLESPAMESTTYKTCPKTTEDVGSVKDVTPGNSYVIASSSCAAGKTIGYEASSTGSLSLNYFQDYNPSPIGLYITVC